MISAKRILEIGTLGAYSTLWLARGLSAGGRVITLEADPHHAAVARKNLARANLTDIVDLRLGRALDTLPTLASEGPFDLIFIDADKPSIADYLTLSIKLSRPGTAILVDNVVRKGAVTDPASTDANVQGVRKFASLLSTLPNLTATTLQTVGSKGYDGFTLILVN
jgi:predicted O-methyltransferase YrrM